MIAHCRRARVVTAVLILAVSLAWLLPVRAPVSAAGPSADTPQTSTQSDPLPTPIGCVSTGSGGGCLVSLQPPLIFKQVGQSTTFTFTCAAAAGLLIGPASQPYSSTGCFDVVASAEDESTGSSSNFSTAVCAGIAAPAGPTVNCGALQNPICAVGAVPGTGGCQLCPSGQQVTQNGCLANPAPDNTCPSGYEPTGKNSAGGLTGCLGPFLSLTPTAQNQATFTIVGSAPQVYGVEITGYVGTRPDGSCPSGTTLAPAVNVGPPGGVPVTAPACAFSLLAEAKFFEVTQLKIIPTSPCNGSLVSSSTGVLGGGACLFRVAAIGQTEIKVGVNCSVEPFGPVVVFPNPPPSTGEPAEGSIDEVGENSAAESAEGVSEGFDEETIPPSQYVCSNGVLSLVGPASGVTINLSATNGVFPRNGACIPSTLAPQPGATPTPTSTPATPTATPTTGPNAGQVSGGFCTPNGSSTEQVVTGPSGVAPLVIGELEAAAIPSNNPTTCAYEPYFTPSDPTAYICGRLFADDAGFAGATMFATFEFPSGPQSFCHSILPTADTRVTDSQGFAICREDNVFFVPSSGGTATPTPTPSPTNTATPGTEVVVTVSFDLGGQLEGNFCTTDTSIVLNGPPPTPTPGLLQVSHCDVSAIGLAVSPLGNGPLSVTASLPSTIDTQPALSVTSTLASFSQATPTPMPTPIPTDTPIPLPTDTPTATPTITSSPVATDTPTPTDTTTPTPTSTTVVSHTLNFSLDAVRVAGPHDNGDRKGLNSVHPGQSVRLMLYYTVHSLPKALHRVTVYQVMYGKRAVLSAQSGGPQAVTDVGTFIRYVQVTMPRNLRYGLYAFHGTLKLGKVSRTKAWRFAVVRNASIGSR